MTVMSRVVSIGLSLILLTIIFELVRRRKLKEKYAVLWLLTGSIILILAIFDKLLSWIIGLLGIQLPINGLLFLGMFFIIIINLFFSLVISNLSEQNKRIVQKLALLEFEMKKDKT